MRKLNFKDLNKCSKKGEIYCSCHFVIKFKDKKWNWKCCMNSYDILWSMAMVPFKIVLLFYVQYNIKRTSERKFYVQYEDCFWKDLSLNFVQERHKSVILTTVS